MGLMSGECCYCGDDIDNSEALWPIEDTTRETCHPRCWIISNVRAMSRDKRERFEHLLSVALRVWKDPV